MKIKKIFPLILLISIFFLAGCQKKSTGLLSDLKKGGSETKETVEDVNLETHKNSQLGIQFKYPQGLIVHDCPYVIRISYQQYPDSICQEGPKETMPPINILEEAGELDSSIKWQEDQLNIISKENLIINGNPAVRMVGTWIHGGMKPELKDTKYEIVFIETSSKAYKVDLSYLEVEKEGENQEKYKKAFDQIVQSLKLNN